ncbi:MAG: efflux RND transporter periplasmic adaptor subunit [Lentisphaeria bacterium]|nr:efflux RND transporter periplasmic adaptor subunit [Lentisphaeria bacterium]
MCCFFQEEKVKKIVIALIVVAVVGLALYSIKSYVDNAIYRDPAFASGNGRLEATEVNVATKLAEKIESVLVKDGDYVKKGQLIAKMQTNVLEAQLAQAKSMVAVKKAELASAKAVVLQKTSSRDNAYRRYKRAEYLVSKNATSQQNFDNDKALFEAADAELAAAKAAVVQAEAAIKAAEADVRRREEDIKDSNLTSPIDGRIQYKVSEPGEVLDAGGCVVNLLDLTDVYMTFFLPEEVAGKVRIGADARILLDALPGIPIPAKITFVANEAQFTPKTVETRIERQKLMFRVKASIPPELLRKYIDIVKTGLPGVAWVKIDPKVEWPEFLRLRKALAATADKAAKAAKAAAPAAKAPAAPAAKAPAAPAASAAKAPGAGAK